jgi:soluble lytic murein transglycosylase-like protein
MRRNLQIVLMAGLAAHLLSSSLAIPPALAQSGGITASTDENGRTIWVNNDRTAGQGSGSGAVGNWGSDAGRGRRLMYWSTTEHRFKPVPTSGAAMRAARSAASEVNSYLDGKAGKSPEGKASGTSSVPALNVAFARAGFTEQEIDAAIEAAAARHNVDPNLVRSVIKVESNFNPNAVSRKGAMGLMQLMPATARSLNVSNPFDPEQNVDAGVRHLRKLLDSYGGDVRLSLAAYNAGAGAVARSAGVPRFGETRNYVRRITELYAGGGAGGTRVVFNPVHEPVRVERDERGVLHMSNTD